MSFRRLLASKFEPMAQFIRTWRAFWVHMAPTWMPEVAKVAIPRGNGIEIAETRFSRTSLEKRRLRAQRRCPNRLQGGIGEDKGRPNKGTHRLPHAVKTMLLCWSGTNFTKLLYVDVTTPTQNHSFTKKRPGRRHDGLLLGSR